MKPKISIIVPIYNKAAFLSRCADSILEQTFTDFEVILVDDGSTDSSLSICNKYAKADSRFKVIHKDNSGVSAARQVGLENVTGDYVIHVDPDDYVEPCFLEALYDEACATGSDIVMCDYNTIIGDKKIVCKQNPKSSDCHTLIPRLFTDIHGSCCNKLIRYCKIKDLSFHYGIAMCEDLIFIYQALLKCEKIAYVGKALYNYVVYQNSLSRRNDETLIENLYEAYLVLKDLIDKYSPDVSSLVLGSFCGHILPRIYKLGPSCYYKNKHIVRTFVSGIWEAPNISITMKIFYSIAESPIGRPFRALFRYVFN